MNKRLAEALARMDARRNVLKGVTLKYREELDSYEKSLQRQGLKSIPPPSPPGIASEEAFGSFSIDATIPATPARRR